MNFKVDMTGVGVVYEGRSKGAAERAFELHCEPRQNRKPGCVVRLFRAGRVAREFTHRADVGNAEYPD